MILGGLLFVLAGVSKPAAKKAKKARADSSPDHSSARTNAKTNISRGIAKSFSPENSFGKTESAFRPAALPRNFLGRTPKEKHPFLFQKKFHPRQIRNARSVFSFGVAGVIASAWGFLRAYYLVSLHHALRAWHISRGSAGNESELFGIMTTNI